MAKLIFLSFLQVYKGFTHAYWAFTKTAMAQTLSVMANEQDEMQALEVFHLILTYAGLIINTKGNVCIS